MSAIDNKELIRRRFEEFAAIREDVAKIRAWCEEYFAPGLTYHSPSKDSNREETIRSWEPWVAAFSDMKMVIDDIVAERDRVMVRITFYGTHRGAFMGIPATGKSIVMEIVTIYKIAGGKIVQVWEYPDELGLMTQLGATMHTPKKW